MSTDNTRTHSDLLERKVEVNTPYRVIAEGDNVDLCYVFECKSNDVEEGYALVSKEGYYVTFGPTGIVNSVSQFASRRKKPDVLLYRPNAFGNFRLGQIHRSVEEILDEVYNTVDKLEFYDPDEKALFEWRAQSVLARFGDYRQFYEDEDIIPEYSDKMNVVKVSDGCPWNCGYCPEGLKKLVLYDKRSIRENMGLVKNVRDKYHERFSTLMTEGFLNTSDLLLYKVRGGVDPIWIADTFREYFPELQKIYTFMGVPTVNEVSQRYLNNLINVERVNRVLIGIETLDVATSRFVNKPFSTKDKINALKKLQAAKFKVKPIIQVGLTGKEFYYNGKWHNSRDALRKTIDKLIETLRRNDSKFTRADKVQISIYTPIEGTKLKDIHDDPSKVRKYASKRALIREARWTAKRFEENNVDAEVGYEVALDNKLNGNGYGNGNGNGDSNKS